MSSLRLRLRGRCPARVDMTPLVPSRLAGLAASAVASIELQCGRDRVKAGDLFHVSGDDTAHVTVEDSSEQLASIGAGNRFGAIDVVGDAGPHLARAMAGGTLTLDGSAGPFAASELSGGTLRIRGNAGDFLGAPAPGSRRGISGGTVIVEGSVGERAGDRMRRGLLLVEGNAGSHCGSRMTAGTIAVLGDIGRGLGFGMQRGTILAWRKPEAIPATFADCGAQEPLFLQLLLRSWRDLGSRFPHVLAKLAARRYLGDRGNDGRGEIIVLA